MAGPFSATDSKKKSITKTILAAPTMWLWSVGLLVGFVVAPLVQGFKLGMTESKKLWKYPDEFTDT